MSSAAPTSSAPPDLEPRLWVKLVIALLVCGVVLGIVSRLSPMTASSAKPSPGSLSASRTNEDGVTTEVTSPSAGVLRKVMVKEGDHVAVGQAVAELDLTSRERQIQLAKARLEGAEETLKLEEAILARLQAELPLRTKLAEQSLAQTKAARATAEASVKQAALESETSVAEAKAGIESARIARDFARKDLDRYASLPPDEAATLRRSQEAAKAFALSVASVKQAEAKLAIAEGSRGRIDLAKHQAEEAVTGEARAATELELAKQAAADRMTEAKAAVAARKLVVTEARQALETSTAGQGDAMVPSPIAGIVVQVVRRPNEGVAVGSVIATIRAGK